MNLEDICAKYISTNEQELRNTLGHCPLTVTDYQLMLYYQMGWENLDQPDIVAGKRIRPLITLLCASAIGCDWQLALPFAAGIELLHNFTLVHDDIQDSSPLRRGRATVWHIWGEGNAINVGDALFAYAHLAMQRATELSSKTRLTALEILDKTCIALTTGQHMDMAFENQAVVTVDQYMEMIELKTAALFAAAAELGALAGGAPKEVRTHYSNFGLHLGLAFQIRDDVLGIWGNTTMTGKSSMTDIETCKKTLPVIYGLERSLALRQVYQTPLEGDVDMTIIIRLLEATSARIFADEEEHRHANVALQHLEKTHPQGEPSEALRMLTHKLLGRTK